MNAVIRDWTNKNSIDRKLLCSPKKIEDHLGQTWNKPLSLEGIKKEKSFKLSQRDFRPENDTVFFGYGKEVENWAGNCSYFHPPKWYEGKALAVKDQEGDWLGSSLDEREDVSWPIVYHGVKNPAFAAPKIIKGAV